MDHHGGVGDDHLHERLIEALAAGDADAAAEAARATWDSRHASPLLDQPMG
ncbi:hypothetical protein ACH0CA_01545 [Kytococcus sedentarius]|uniref:hypothetical protein n=1 Tax=Kytococcus sedentarius TaxID=1276 RepID=UPI00387A3505